MKIFLIILLLPFVILFSLVKTIYTIVSGTRNLKYIPKIIERLAENEEPSTAVGEIKFPQVLAYAEEMGTLILSTKEANSFDFVVTINSKDFGVNVRRSPDGYNRAIFNAWRLVNAVSTTSSSRNCSDSKGEKTVDKLIRAYSEHERECSW